MERCFFAARAASHGCFEPSGVCSGPFDLIQPVLACCLANTIRRRCAKPLVIALAAALLGLISQPARAITPQDPRVRQAVDKAVGYLLNIRPEEGRGIDMSGSVNPEIGVQCLVALALLKADVDPPNPPKYKDHPLVTQAVNNFKASVRSGSISKGYHSVYNLGVGTVMLAALKDREGVQMALKHLLAFQRDHGGFSSETHAIATGDNSMTQYAVLGHVGSLASRRYRSGAGLGARDGLADEDPTARRDPHVHARKSYRPGQPPVPHSMTAAGLGGLYICANIARPRGKSSTAPEPKKRDPADNVPSALTPVSDKKKEAEKEKAGQISLDMGLLQQKMALGDAWMEKNFKDSFTLTQWQLYYLYAVERYFSFREKWEGVQPEEPEWYTQGANYLLQTQQANGGWTKDYNERVSTCFALLFLVRNTKKSLIVTKAEEKAAGTLLSGSGLPTDLSNIRVKDGQLVVKPLAGPAGELLEIIEKPDDPKFLEAVEGMKDLVVQPDDIMLSSHLVRLRKMAKNPSPEARAAAVTILGKSRDLDSVPTLLYALRDEDGQVVRAAWDALKFVSRRFDSFGLSPNFKGENPRERAAAKERAIERWQAWYRSVRPDAELDE